MNVNIPPLYNIEIHEYLKLYQLPYYKGVYSSNNIPNFTKNYIFICNLSNDYEKGSHFITICNVDSHLFILDSLAMNIANSELYLNVKEKFKNCKKLITIDKPIQSMTSQGCGIYCIFFVLFFHAKIGKKLASLNLLPFDGRILENNDSICIANINTLVNHANI